MHISFMLLDKRELTRQGAIMPLWTPPFDALGRYLRTDGQKYLTLCNTFLRSIPDEQSAEKLTITLSLTRFCQEAWGEHLCEASLEVISAHGDFIELSTSLSQYLFLVNLVCSTLVY